MEKVHHGEINKMKKIVAMQLVGGSFTDVSTAFNTYLDLLSDMNKSITKPLNTDPTNILNVEDLISNSTDILSDIQNLGNINKDRLKNHSCPIFNPGIDSNLPTVSEIPPIPDLGFLQELNIPITAMVAMFGGYGRVLLKAGTVYAAHTIKNELINMSRGDEHVIEIASKLAIALTTISDLQYLLAQPVVTPAGPGTLLVT